MCRKNKFIFCWQSTDTLEQAMLPSQAAFKCVPVIKHTEFIEIVCAESLTDQVQVRLTYFL